MEKYRIIEVGGLYMLARKDGKTFEEEGYFAVQSFNFSSYKAAISAAKNLHEKTKGV